jgi:dTDP-glucose pyrophosphorylase
VLNIVMPIAGRGSRFVQAGYSQPKPLIPVHGRPMIQFVVDNLRPSRPHHFIFLALREHLEQWNIGDTLKQAAPGCSIVVVDQVTEGAACTVLLAQQLIDDDAPLMIANTDQYVAAPVDRYLADTDTRGVDGLIMTFPASDPKWSFVRKNAAGDVIEVVEKKVVSNEATVGIYNFSRGADFVRAAHAMIAKDLRVNGEFYVAPVYNELIEAGMKIRSYEIGAEGVGMFGLGTPPDLEAFLARPTPSFAAGPA